MNKTLKGALASLCAALLAMLAVACGTQDAGTQSSAATVRLETTAITLKVGESYKLSATASGNAALAWSADSDVVSVDDGTVRGVKVGSAVVCVTAGKASDYCQVTVVRSAQSAVGDEVKKDGYIYYEDFEGRTAVPGYLRTIMSGGGNMGVSDGEMYLDTLGTGSSFATYVFDETLSGKIIVKTRVKVSSRQFSNILFFYRGEYGYSTNDVIACLGMNAGSFQNHNGSAWYGIGKSYSTGTWYEIRMELSIGEGYYDLYIDGEKFSRLPLRKTGDGVEDRIKLLKFGTDKENCGLTYDYISVEQGSDESAAEIEQTRAVYRLGLNDGNTVTLEYRYGGNPRPTLTLVPDVGNPAGATVGADNKTITFADGAEQGTYGFTLTAQNKLGSASKHFTVIVSADNSVLLDTDFSTEPDGMTFVATSGTAGVSGGRLVLTTQSSGSVLTQARYDFGEALSGRVRAKATVTVGTNSFSNILYLFHSGTTGFVAGNCTNSIAVENGVLKYNAGGWKSIKNITLGEAFELEVLFDFDSHTFDLWLDGEQLLTAAPMRKTTGDSSVLMLGADKTNVSIVYDRLSFTRED